jgi:membrane protein
MRYRMVNLWTLGGLSLPELLRRTARASWQDEVFGQGGRMAFYHFLAIFPSLLLFFLASAHIPHLGDHMRIALQEMSSQVLPGQVSELLQKVMDEVNELARTGVQLISVCGGALWAALNGTWAMIYGLNKAYEVDEDRSWRKLTITIVGLTFSLAITGSIAVVLIFCSAYLQAQFHGGAFALRCLEWLVLIPTLSCSFSLLYRFAPNLGDCEWRWSTPGAFCALILWIGSTFAARIYFNHVNYARSYGHLDGVVMLLMWLYLTNGAILIGGEMNSEIEKTVTGRRNTPVENHHPQDRSSEKPGESLHSLFRR